MGGLAHYLEADGLPTTQISLIREHTEVIRPPRALWVPFELGRPLGVPEDPVFQRRVLLSALALLNAPQGPVLEDFPVDFSGDAPSGESVAGGAEGWVCPVTFPARSGQDANMEQLRSNLEQEMTELRPWYDLGLDKRGHSAMTGFTPDSVAPFLLEFVLNSADEGPPPELPLPVALRMAAQDLKAFYFEAIASQPEKAVPESAVFNSWFWRETAGGDLLRAVKKQCLTGADETLRLTGSLLLVPADQS